MMTTTKTPDIDAAVEACNTVVDKLSDTLFNLGQVTQLVAFAVEARRTLELYSSQAEHFPDFKNHVQNSGECSNNWRQVEDTSAEVLQRVVCEIEACTVDLHDGTQCVRDLHSDRIGALKRPVPGWPVHR